MAVQVVIFLAFTSVTLIFNSLVIWFAYKAFADITLRVTGTIREIQATDGVRSWMKALEVASSQAVTVTSVTRTRVQEFEPVLVKAQSNLGYGLATVDVRVESFCDNVRKHTRSAQELVEGPAERVGLAMSGVRDILSRVNDFVLDQNDADASSKPST